MARLVRRTSLTMPCLNEKAKEKKTHAFFPFAWQHYLADVIVSSESLAAWRMAGP